MPTEFVRGDAAWAVLESLVDEAPLDVLDRLVEQAEAAGASTEALAELTRGRQLARDMRGLLDERRRHVAGLTALVDLSRELALTGDLDALLALVTRRARALVGTDIAHIDIHDQVTGTGLAYSCDGLTVTQVEADSPPGFAAGEPEAVWTADHTAGSWLPVRPAIEEALAAQGLRGWIAIPLRDGGSFRGEIYLADRGVRHFTPDELSLITSLGALAEIAIGKALRLGRDRAEADRLRERAARAADTAAALDLVREAQSELLDLVLGGGDRTAVTAAAAEVLDGTLVVVDPAGRVLTATGEIPGLEHLGAWSALLEARGGAAPLELTQDTWITPIGLPDRGLGALLLHRAAPLREIDRRAVLAVAQGIAVTLLIECSAHTAEGQVRVQFLDDLLVAHQRPCGPLADRARRLGMDLTAPHVVVVARPEGGSLGRAIVWAAAYAHRTGGLAKESGGRIVLLVPGAHGGVAAGAELAALLGHPVTTGASDPIVDLGEVPRAHKEALRCLDALTLLNATGQTASSRDLGFLGMLLSDNHDVDGFINATLGVLVDYDRMHHTELTATVEVYFEAGASPTYAAEALYVHPNTVSRRLSRIAALLGPDWQTPAKAMEIQLALRLRRTRKSLLRTPV
ncbi:helix-turn-helix domain-containing protein [Actinokineospora sp. NBRC 105648]|uniref:helix-turn-helix domain-containing protein n=1 Tax=Actinokineospora sp. NBRC 105648 TaxID=3032206 RepID=UPI0024A049D8|nr:helix-turn-helix domain-containing protein [Actinokineospora sp. NBRC 105648]GLZ36602.1 hypothetical protein Acsp05_02270 [Actinokineospora sp. NBRC 105648]